jgi:hypothetical protein
MVLERVHRKRGWLVLVNKRDFCLVHECKRRDWL